MIRSVLLLFLAVLAAPPLPRPVEERPVRFELSAPRRSVLSNGIVVHVMEDRTLPTVEVSAIFTVGRASDPEGLGGLAEVTAEAMRSGGAGERKENLFEEALADLAARIEHDAGVDLTTLSVWAPAQSAEGALALFADLLRRPRLSAAAVRTARERRAEEARREADDPETLVIREYTRRLFAGHPYGNWPSEDSLRRIRRGTVRDFYRRHYGPQSLTLAAAGDFTSEALLGRLEELFGDWEPPVFPAEAAGGPGAAADESGTEGVATPGDRVVRRAAEPATEKTEPAAPAWAQRAVVPRPLSQSTFVFGHRGPPWDHADLPALEIIGEILSYYHYYSDVRDNHGLAYTAFGSYDEQRRGGHFMSFAGTRAEATQETLALMRSHFDDVAAGRFSDEEAEGARRFVAASFVHRFATAADAVREFAMAEIRGLPPEWLTGYTRRVEALQPDDLRRAARAHLHPDDLLLVIVGDPQQIDRTPQP